MNNDTTNLKLKDWCFGRYIDSQRQLAFLIITYHSIGGVAKRPLELPYSDYANPNTVMKKLLNAAADIDAKADLAELKTRLLDLNVNDGVYLQRSGQHEDCFFLAGKAYGRPAVPTLVDGRLTLIADAHFGRAGSWATWKKQVAEPAEQSSYMMFAIALGVAAPIYDELIDDEGVLFNLAGVSGLGKSTATMAARSVSGPRSRLFDWKMTPRGVSEALAACSDTLFFIDDWEKIDASGSRSRLVQTFTHLITSGSSKAYSGTVKGELPDLTWCCPVLTSGPRSIEKQAEDDRLTRSNGDRRRCIDISIEANEGAGIWDLLDDSDDPGLRSHKIRKAAKNHYGQLLHRWLEVIEEERDEIIADAQDLMDGYCADMKLHGDAGFEQTITRKFAIVYAAGSLAIDCDFLPWKKPTFRKAVEKLHNLARNEIRSKAQILKTAILSVNEATCDAKVYPYVKTASQAKFKNKSSVTGFILETRTKRRLFLTLPHLEYLIGGSEAADLFIEQMGRINAHIKGPKNRTCGQPQITVGGKPHRPRMLQINLDAFDREVDRLSADQSES